MAKRLRDSEKNFRNIMNAAAESVIEASDEETLQEAKEIGLDIKKESDSVRAIFNAALRSERQKKLNEAETTYRRTVETMKHKTYALPQTLGERRALLEGIFSRKPELKGLLTAQHREFKDLPEEDIEELLKQLQELGSINKD